MYSYITLTGSVVDIGRLHGTADILMIAIQLAIDLLTYDTRLYSLHACWLGGVKGHHSGWVHGDFFAIQRPSA